MNDPKQPVQLLQAKRTVQDLITSDRAKAEIAKVLPKHLTPERMTRVALTATLKNPGLLECFPESLMNALLICSQAGLEPDGRLAHLIPYGKVVQVIFDYKGLVTLALRNGAESVFADKVCEHDLFEAGVENGKKVLNHKVNWKKERGIPVAYYAVCIRGGEADWEVMTLEEVEAIRKRSRAANNGPWVTDFDEMGKKTVLRRMSKRWDLLPEIRDVINADDDTPPPFNGLIVSKPIFDTPVKQVAAIVPEETPTTETKLPVGETKPPVAAPETPLPATKVPEPATEPPQAEKSAYNPLKALRALLKMGSHKEAELLDFLATTGATDGSQASLEDVMLTMPQVIQSTAENFAPISAKLKELKGGGK